MPNPYYSHSSGVPQSLSRGVSSNLRAEFDLLVAAFDLVYQAVFQAALPGISSSTKGMVPSNDGSTAAWVALPSKPWTPVSGTTQAAAAGNAYSLTNASATTVTLPASPAANDIVAVKVSNGRTDNVINPNGNTIEGVGGNMTVDNQYAAFSLQYINSSWRVV